MQKFSSQDNSPKDRQIVLYQAEQKQTNPVLKSFFKYHLVQILKQNHKISKEFLKDFYREMNQSAEYCPNLSDMIEEIDQMDIDQLESEISGSF